MPDDVFSKEEKDARALKVFLNIGLTDVSARDTVKNRKLRDALMDVAGEAGATSGTEKATGALLYEVAVKFPKKALQHRPYLLTEYIMKSVIKNKDQLTGGLNYLGSLNDKMPDWAVFEQESGIGVTVSAEDVRNAVAAVLSAEHDRIQEDRYQSRGVLLGKVRSRVKWAAVEDVKAELQKQLDDVLGGMTAQDEEDPAKKPKKKREKPVKAAQPVSVPAHPSKDSVTNGELPDVDLWSHLGRPEDNFSVHTTVSFSDGSSMNISNSAESLQKHLELTKGQVRTRFPPEPNGYLHIGHAKAMHVSFGMARHTGGICFLRFDDTNPEAEKQEYIDHIEEIVSWLGWKPFKVTYSSDYFQELYDLAVKLISTGNAFVCHQTAEEISRSRETRSPSPWRERPVEESLRLFEEMRLGLHEEGSATLRMKQDVGNDNYNMFDLVAYRIKYTRHPKAGDTWCIYPSYDYTHCIVDSLEHITHSLCTLEFESRRASYFWLLQALELFMPYVWEYGRLNVQYNVLSKRKLNKLASGGLVNGWDDPRLLTLAGLRRRGVTPAAINNFCRELGITRSDAAIHMHKLEYHVRTELDETSPRALAVLRPLRIVLTNLKEHESFAINAEVFPNNKANKDTYQVHVTREIWIERTDFREDDIKGYYGLAPGKTVMLRYAGYITCTKVEKVANSIASLEATFEPLDSRKPPKGVLNWVGRTADGGHPFQFEARLYEPLFKSEDPANLGDDWLQDLSPLSKVVLKGAMGSAPLKAASMGSRYQLERLGYFCVDPDSTADLLVLNRTVTLKESTAKPLTQLL